MRSIPLSVSDGFLAAGFAADIWTGYWGGAFQEVFLCKRKRRAVSNSGLRIKS